MSNPNKFDQRGTFIRFSIPGAKIPGSDTYVPDLLVKSYWESFAVKMQEKITRSKTMGGWVEEHWPPDLDTVSVNGSTGAFIIVGDANVLGLESLPRSDKVGVASSSEDALKDTSKVVGDNSVKGTKESSASGSSQTGKVFSKPGVSNSQKRDYGLATGDQVFLRRLSEAALNLESLAHFYRSNGATFEVDGQVAEIRDIDMHYMGDVYRGYFSDFSFTHSSESPNLFTYSFTFRVRETFLTDTSPVNSKNVLPEATPSTRKTFNQKVNDLLGTVGLRNYEA